MWSNLKGIMLITPVVLFILLIMTRFFLSAVSHNLNSQFYNFAGCGHVLGGSGNKDVFRARPTPVGTLYVIYHGKVLSIVSETKP